MLINRLGEHLPNVKGAIHVGAHEGEERGWYKDMKFTQVYWFEPNKIPFQVLKYNLRSYGNQFAVNMGVHDILKETKLHVANNGQSSSILEFGTHKKYHPAVKYVGDQDIKLVRIDEFFNYEYLKQFNILNVDVQGVELNVIKSFGEWITVLDYINAEVNEQETYIGGQLIGEIDEYLSGYGFTRKVTEMTSAHWGDALYVKDGIV